jgi:HrpA-like RNA helicase
MAQYIRPAIDGVVEATQPIIYNRHKHLNYSQQRQLLPVWQHRKHILYAIEKYSTLILVGETGSGKSLNFILFSLNLSNTVCSS